MKGGVQRNLIIPARQMFQGVLGWLKNTGQTYREERIHERLTKKKGRAGKRHKVLSAFRKKRWLRKIARLSRRKNRQVEARR